MAKKPQVPNIAPKNLKCPRCAVAMDTGFVLDRYDDGRFGTEEWVPTPLERSFWTGVKLKGKKLLPVATFRCPQCGLLQSFAG